MLNELLAFQPQIVSALEKGVTDNTLPRALLFTGPEYSCRMSTALALAKELSLSTAQDTLIPSNTLIISSRDHKRRIRAVLERLKEQDGEDLRRQLGESVGIMLSQYHTALADAATPTVKKLFDAAGTTQDTLEDVLALPIQDKKLPSRLKALEKNLAILDTAPSSSRILTIAQCREIQSWCRLTALDRQPKIAIIENIEAATEGAKNSLLKLLETPPENAWFILISSQPGRILPTILSRVRHYQFSPLPAMTVQQILATRYALSSASQDSDVLRAAASLKAFFLFYGEKPENRQKLTELRMDAEAFLSGIIVGPPLESSAISMLAAKIEDNDMVQFFFESLIQHLKDKSSGISLSGAQALLLCIISL